MDRNGASNDVPITDEQLAVKQQELRTMRASIERTLAALDGALQLVSELRALIAETPSE